MTMNKKEKEAMQALRVRAALHWTGPVERDLPPPASFTHKVSQGFDFNENTLEVYPAWSGSVNHGRGIYVDGDRRQSASQGSRRLFSTELLANLALRHAVEKKAAERLAMVDESIEALRGAA